MVAPAGSFVGREHELETLHAALDEAIAGQGRIIMLAGEPGIGKTRTAQELADHAGRHGASVLWGRCYEEAGAPPYWPWVQIFRGALTVADPRALLAEVGAAASDMADILPEIRDLAPTLEQSQRLEDPAQARFRMFESIHRFIASLSRSRTVLLVLDDLHWADAPSLRLLEFLAPEIADSRLLLVGTYRANELSRQHPLSDALGGLARVPHVTRLLLTGLNAGEVHDFIAATTGTDPPAPLTSSLHGQTEGNPLFLREIVRFLQARGLFSPSSTVLPLTIRIPEGVKEVIGRRLNLLSAACNDVLALASVIGREFALDLLLHATELGGDDRTLEALDEALAAHVIEESANGRYQFTHNLIRMTLYDELRPARRRQLHQAVGNALEASRRAEIGATLPELARHFLAAGDVDKAIEYARRAGERAEALLAFEDAVESFQAALEALEQRPQPDDAARCRLLFLLGEALRKSSDFSRALATLRQAAELATTLDLPEISARAAMAYEHVAWRHAKATEPPPRRLLERALQRITCSEPALAAEVTAALSRALWLEGRAPEAVLQGERAIAMARQIGEPGVLAACLWRVLEMFAGHESEDFLRLATETLTAASHVGNLELMHLVHGWRFVAFMERGETALAEAEVEAVERLESRLRQPTYAFAVKLHRVMLALMRGELAEAERVITQAIALTRKAPAHQEQLSVQIFTLRREQGRLGELQPVLSAFLRQATVGSIWRPGLAVLHLELDQPDAARIVFEQTASESFAAIPRDGRWLPCIICLCEVCAELGDAARAAELYELMRPYSGRNVLAGILVYYGSADRHLGMLSATMGNWSDAEHHFAAALAMNSRIGAGLPLVHTQYDFATMLLARRAQGDRERAEALLRDSLESARQLGMRGLEKKAAALLRQQPAVTPPSGVNDDLTAREIEVLSLIAIGRSNADIAIVLEISLNTVATHVRNILAKTGCANRTEAAAYAMRNGLAAVVQ